MTDCKRNFTNQHDASYVSGAVIPQKFKETVDNAGSRLKIFKESSNKPVDESSKELSLEDLMQKACALQDIGRLEEAASVLAEANRLLEKIEMKSCASDDVMNTSFNDFVGDIDEERLSICTTLSADTFNLLKTDKELDDAFKSPKKEIHHHEKPSVVVNETKAEIKSENKSESRVPQPHYQAKPTVSKTEKVAPEKPKVDLSKGIDYFLLKDVTVHTTPLESVNQQLLRQSKPAEETANIAHHHNIATSRRTVTKAGYLLLSVRRGIVFYVWKKKYVILTGRLLLIFRSAKATKCEKVLDLCKAEVEAVRMQIKKGSKNTTAYEFRIREWGKTDVLRFRCTKAEQKFLLRDQDNMSFVSKWASNIKNNILISSKNLDVHTEELDALLRLHRKARKRSDTNDSEQESEDESPAQLFKGRLRQSERAKTQASSWRELDHNSAIDEARKKKHFTTNRNSSEFALGADIGARAQDEKIFENYKLLNVPVNSTDSEIKKSYRSLARDNHPDKNINNVEMEEKTRRFAAISQAFNVLKFKETRAAYDLCENVKEILRKGVVVRLHRVEENPKQQLLFIDKRFLNLYLQDVEYGTVLRRGYRTIELRFVTHIYRGIDGFAFANRDVEEAQASATIFPHGQADCFLTLHGDRLGEQDWHLQMANEESRDQLLEGLRKLRCDNSELFKQRLEEMLAQGLS